MKTVGNYPAFYGLIYNTIGGLTPLDYDCGILCGKACCKGEDAGMLLFPHVEEALDLSPCTVTEQDGSLLVRNVPQQARRVLDAAGIGRLVTIR